MSLKYCEKCEITYIGKKCDGCMANGTLEGFSYDLEECRRFSKNRLYPFMDGVKNYKDIVLYRKPFLNPDQIDWNKNYGYHLMNDGVNMNSIKEIDVENISLHFENYLKGVKNG